VGRLGFVSLLPKHLFENMLDRGSFDFLAIGGRKGAGRSVATLMERDCRVKTLRRYLRTKVQK